MKKKIVAILLALVLVISATSLSVFAEDESIFTGNEWYNETSTVSVNALYPRSTFTVFGDKALALANPTDILKTNSDRVIDLNGTWKFNLVMAPANRPSIANLTVAGLAENEDWIDLKVPSSWQVAEQYAGVYGDYPVYTNQDYAWQGRQYENTRLTNTAPTNVNPVGSYVRSFNVAEDWDGSEMFISFQGVESAFYVWVNGVEIGYAEDTCTTHEFDITKAVHTGTNTIAVQVFRWSTGSFMENQDGINFGGICRDVFIFSTPKVHIRDFKAETDLDENYVDADLKLRVNVQNHTAEDAAGYQVRASLYDAAGAVVFDGIDMQTPIDTVTANGELVLNFSKTVTNPNKWTAETPYLYTLLIELIDSTGKTTEYISKRIGFKEIELDRTTNANAWEMKINGNYFIFYGANRGEVSPKGGRYIDYETLKKDVYNAKLLNVNAFRTSHYPSTPALYDLCDEYGIYVMDENNNESHNGRNYSPAIPNSSGWTESCRYRITNMVERDKNNTCVVMWSMGNEAGSGSNTTMMIQTARALDPTKLIHYQGNNPSQNGSWNADLPDVYALMYPAASAMQSYNARFPHIAMEVEHAMGNAMGGLYAYVNAWESNRRVQGGFIWDYVDQAVDTLVPGTETGETYWGVGGSWLDWQDQGGVGDGNFCVNGFINPDRTFEPEAYEVKKQYQGVKMTANDADLMAGNITFKNNYSVRNANYFDIVWALVEDNTVLQQGTVENFDVPAQTTQVVNIPFTMPETLKAGADYFLNIYLVLKDDMGYAERGYVQCSEQFLLPVSTGSTMVKLSALQNEFTKNEETETELTVEGKTDDNKSFSAVINKSTGLLTSYKVDGREIIASSPVPNMYRAEIDNDTGGNAYTGTAAPYQEWATVTNNMTVNSVNVTKSGKFSIVDVAMTIGAKSSTYMLKYFIAANGDITISASMPANSAASELAEFGMMMELNPALENFMYFGRGPEENYPDRMSGYDIGVYSTTATDNNSHYVRPQEMGNRTDVRWSAHTDEAGNGIMIVAEEGATLNVNASHYTPLSLSSYNNRFSDTQYPILRYQFQPVASENVVLRVAGAVEGVGGETWSTRTYAQYQLLSNKAYNYTYTIRPISENQDAMTRSKGLVEGPKSLQNILLDGEPVKGFDPGKYVYDLPLRTIVPPVVTVEGGDDMDIQIVQAESVPGTATVTATSNGITSVYTLNFSKSTTGETYNLQDIPYLYSSVGYGTLTRGGTDSAGVGAPIQMYAGNNKTNKTTFETGVGLSADAYIVLDLSEMYADTFTFNFGCDANYTRSNGNGPSVKLKVYVSDEVLPTPNSVNSTRALFNQMELIHDGKLVSQASGSSASAYDHGELDISGKKFMILFVDSNGNTGHDHAQFGDTTFSSAYKPEAFEALIAQARDLAENADYGGSIGQYPQSAKTALEAAIATAEYDLYAAFSQQELDAGAAKLESAIESFYASKITEVQLIPQSLTVSGNNATSVFAIKNNAGGTISYKAVLALLDENYAQIASASVSATSSSDNDDSSLTVTAPVDLTQGTYYARLTLLKPDGSLYVPYVTYKIENGESAVLPIVPIEKIADGISIEAPASVTATEPFQVKVTVPNPYSKVKILNEKGNKLSAKLVNVEADGTNSILTYELAIGTPGTGRVLSTEVSTPDGMTVAGPSTDPIEVKESTAFKILDISAPASANPNETFEIEVTTSKLDSFVITGEKGGKITSRVVNVVENANGTATYTLSLAVGTSGARTLTVTGTGLGKSDSKTFDIRIGARPQVISAALAQSGEVEAGAKFDINVVTSDTVSALAVTNEKGGKISFTVKDKTAADGQIAWTISLSVGTAGERTFNIAGTGLGETSAPVAVPVTVVSTPKLISAEFTSEEVAVNANAEIKVVATSAISKIDLLNENAESMSKTTVSRVNNGDGTITWTFNVSFGTAGERTVMALGYNANNKPVGSTISMDINVVAAE